MDNKVFFNTALLNSLQSLNNEYAQILTEFFDCETVKNHEFAFKATDEMIALYLHAPLLFSFTREGNTITCTAIDANGLRSSSLGILKTTRHKLALAATK
jgi:hypothetical protein